MKMTRHLLLGLLATAAATATTASAQVAARRGTLVIDHPCPKADAYFGHATCVLDMDGIGGPELAVGAFGHGQVFVFPDVSMQAAGSPTTYMSSGVVTCGAAGAGDHFGYDVAGGDLDGDPFDELVVGAPATQVGPVLSAGMVYIFRHPGDIDPVLLRELNPGPSRFGDSVAVGDFDGDGFGDVAVSAPKTEVGGVAAGAVHIFFGPFDVVPPSLKIENPSPVLHGNFGHHLAVADVDLDGTDDLVVSAIGNSNQAGLPVAGQVYVYTGPIDPAKRLLIEDPFPDANDLPGPRFGMHVDARADWVLVGANRKDWLGVHDAGMGFSVRGTNVNSVNLHPYPDPSPSDYMGFRCAVADVTGDSGLDITFVIMPNQSGPSVDPQAMVTWDGRYLFGPPALIRPALPMSADHFANGLVAAQVKPGGREELVAGDGTFDVPGSGNGNDTGRVVIYAYD